MVTDTPFDYFVVGFGWGDLGFVYLVMVFFSFVFVLEKRVSLWSPNQPPTPHGWVITGTLSHFLPLQRALLMIYIRKTELPHAVKSLSSA